MSITGYSYSLSFRRRQKALGGLSGHLSRNEVFADRVDQNANQPRDSFSDNRSPQFSVQQSFLKRSLPNGMRLFMQPSSIEAGCTQFDSHTNQNSPRRHVTNTQDTRLPPPRHRADGKAQIRPNETHPNGTNKKDQKSAAARKPGIVVIHQRAFFRDCFVRCLEISYGSHRIFAFANISDWRNSAEHSSVTPAVIVFFLDATESSSIADLQFLESSAADIPVVIMSDIDDTNYVIHALRNGARGYIPTSLSFNVAVEAVRLVEAGGTFVPVSSLVLDRDKQETTSRTNELLTERQMMVVEALCRGMANKRIAYELGMSEHTVKVHLRHIMRKLKVRNRTEVAVLTKDFFERTGEQR